MKEQWDVYDINKKRTGKTVERGENALKEGEYHLVVNAVIMNSNGEILLSKRGAHKKFGLMWELSGGSVLAGETSLDGMIREIKEELGLQFKKEDAMLIKELRRDKIPPAFKSLWLFRKNIELKDIRFPDREVVDAKWVNIEEFLKMLNKKELVPTIDFDVEDYQKTLNTNY